VLWAQAVRKVEWQGGYYAYLILRQNREPTKEPPDATLSWRKEFLKEFSETDASRITTRWPVIVLSSGPCASESEHHSLRVRK